MKLLYKSLDFLGEYFLVRKLLIASLSKNFYYGGTMDRLSKSAILDSENFWRMGLEDTAFLSKEGFSPRNFVFF